MMDYLFKGAATQEEFELRLLLAGMQAQANSGSNFLGDIFKMSLLNGPGFDPV